jgi:hypothetical protein
VTSTPAKTDKGQVVDLALAVSRPPMSAPANIGHQRTMPHFTGGFPF